MNYRCMIRKEPLTAILNTLDNFFSKFLSKGESAKLYEQEEGTPQINSAVQNSCAISRCDREYK